MAKIVKVLQRLKLIFLSMIKVNLNDNTNARKIHQQEISEAKRKLKEIQARADRLQISIDLGQRNPRHRN